MINREILAKLRDKEMDRKDFLKYSGVVLLAAVGLKGVLALLAPADKPIVSTATDQKRGFGAGKYGV